jgi:hypothetical protein
MRLPALGLFIVAAFAQARGQVARGSVVHADSVTPAAGVIVQLVDAQGIVVAAALAGSRGDFALRGRSAGVHRVRALRIGYRPTTSSALALVPDSAVSVKIVLGVEGVVLPVVAVRGRTDCRLRPDAALAVAQAWEEARKALTAASLTAEAERFTSTVVTYERAVDSLDDVVAFQRSQVARTTRPHVFESLPPDSLQRVGYVVMDGEQVVYFGPDAAVLLSEEFLATHCLRLEPAPNGDTSAVAVAFEPAGRRRAGVDVKGVLVIDRRTSELRFLEFRYVGLPRAADRAGAGGRVEFARIENGAWFVSRWELRMPMFSIVVADAARAPEITERSDATVEEIRLAGGELLEVTLGDSVVRQGVGRRIEGRVVHVDGGRPVTRARAFLSGTDYRADVDSAGRFVLDEVIPGRYRIGAASPELDSLGLVPADRIVDVRAADVGSIDLAIPTAEALFASVCGRGTAAGTSAMVRGTVRAEGTGAPVGAAKVVISWQPVDASGEPDPRRRLERREIRSDADGSYRLCGVPRQARLTAHAEHAGERGPMVAVRVPMRPFVIMPLVVPRS